MTMRSEGPLFFRATATSVQRRPVVVKRAGRWHRSNIEEGRDNEKATKAATFPFPDLREAGLEPPEDEWPTRPSG
jgi:hypothetical protein